MRILSSVFLIKIFDLRLKELKYEKELLLNRCRKKICTNFFQVAGHAWVELKQSHKPLTQGMFRSLILVHKAEERKIAGRINSYKLTETNS